MVPCSEFMVSVVVANVGAENIDAGLARRLQLSWLSSRTQNRERGTGNQNAEHARLRAKRFGEVSP
jgi:hypothetical protein